MSSPVVTVSLNTALQEVQNIFTERDINHLPVVDEAGKVVGMLSSSDLSKLSNWKALFRPKQVPGLSTQLLNSLLAEELMAKPVITLHATASLKEAAQLIRSRTFHALPIVDENEKLIGIITAHDLLRAAYGD